MADADCLHCKLMPQVAEFARTHDDDSTIGAPVNCLGEFIASRPSAGARYFHFARSVATLSALMSGGFSGTPAARQVGHG